MKNRKAAMEMSVGTIVTIVLLMTVLILGLTFVRSIFTSSTENINSIDQAVKSEVNKLFAEDSSRRLVIYPPSREISIKQGDSAGFGFSIRNVNEETKTFSYQVTATGTSCDGLSTPQANDLIILRGSGEGIQLASGASFEDPILVKFDIPETTPLCIIGYNLDVMIGSEPYASSSIDLEIK